MGRIKAFVREDEGVDLIEYALLAGLLSLACFGVLTSVGGSLTGLFSTVSTKLQSVLE